MAIIQISKIQVRSGNLVDLPQLDEAEFGWASDNKRLFIGKTTPNENIEILTSYSNIDFSQLTGSYGNLNINSPVTGQVLVYDQSSNAWLNAGGNASDPGEPSYWSSNPIHLGNVSTLKIGGGAIGYVLETDGTGNLTWTPKGVISANISNASQTNPVVITTSSDNFFTDSDLVTITNVSGMTQLNGNSYYANVLTSNTFSLYSDSALTIPVNGTGYGAYTGNGRAIASIGGSGGGGGGAGGTTYSVQYNYAGVSTGDASFTWNNTISTLTVTGTANISGNLNVSGNVTASRLISNIATGTAPLTVTSTTRVSNLNVSHSNVTDFVSVTTATTGLHYPILANALTGNVSEVANANLTFNVATGLLSASALSITGNANVGNLDTSTAIITTGNITTINSGLLQNGNSNITITANGNIAMTAAGGTTELVITSTGANVNGTLSVSGNANIGNLGTNTAIITTGNITTINSGLLQNGNSNITITSNGNVAITAAGGTTELIVTSTGANINGTLSVSGNATIGNISGIIRPTAGSGEAGIIFPADPGGGSGDLATIKYYASTGESTVLELAVTNDSDDKIYLNATGGTNVAGVLQTTSISTGANTTAGNITGNWVLTSGSRLQATYADLAEYYEADQPYEPGTVLMFGGEKEVTIAVDGTTKVAGVVSTDPAYLMNSNCPGHKVAIALQGRVPVKVRGTVRKGDLMVSGGSGYARPWNHASMGMVIGKSIQDFDGIEGIIEIAVGRL